MSLPKPYYQDDWCQIFCADCREILPELPKVDLVLTDPPYGVSGEQNSKSSSKKNDYLGMIDSIEFVWNVCAPVVALCVSQIGRVILTPGNRCLTFYPAPDSFGCFYQPASIGLQPWGRADSQPIFYYGKFPRDSKAIPGSACSFILTETAEKNGHPCSKPIAAWKRLLSIGSLELETVLDPFMGSGTTLRAAKDLGRKSIGIEIEEKYCEIAVERLRQEVFAL